MKFELPEEKTFNTLVMKKEVNMKVDGYAVGGRSERSWELGKNMLKIYCINFLKKIKY